MLPRIWIFLFFLVGGMVVSDPMAAQPIHLDWFRQIGNVSGDESVTALVIDSNKSVIATGAFAGTVDFDTGPGVANLSSAGANDVYFTEYDSTGRFIWAKRIGGGFSDDVLDIKMDNRSNLYILGKFQSTVDFDPGPGVFNVTTTFLSGFLLKLDNNGNFLSVIRLPNDVADFDFDRNGNIILSRGFFGTVDFDPGPGVTLLTAAGNWEDMFVLKLDSLMQFSWVRQIRNLGTGEVQQFGLRTDPRGNIFFAGNFSGTMDFDPGAGVTAFTSAGSDDAFLLKLDLNGHLRWATNYGAQGSDKIFALETDETGNVYTTGQFFNTVDFDPGPGNLFLTAGGGRSCFISKLDSSGHLVFAENFQGAGETWGQAMAIDSSNFVYLSGGFRGTVDFDPTAGVSIENFGGLFNARIDSNGQIAWVAPYVASTNNFESIYSYLRVDIMKNVYYVSSFVGTVDFDPTAGVRNFTAAGSWDGLLLKLGQCSNTLRIIDAQDCGGITLNGKTYRTTGVYYQTLTGANSDGCDSIIQINFLRPDPFVPITVTACDRYTWNGTTYTSSGIYFYTVPLASGCDSVTQLTLTITKIIQTVNADVCGAFHFNGRILKASGVYRDSIRLAGGCDSTIILNLTVRTNPAPNLGADTCLVFGASRTLNPGSFSSYSWNTGSTAGSLLAADTGTYWVSVTAQNGCSVADSIRLPRCVERCSLTAETRLGPSPFRDYVTIRKNPTQCLVRLNLYNSIGQLLINGRLVSDGSNRLDLPNLPAGVYFYSLMSDESILRKGKLIKL